MAKSQEKEKFLKSAKGGGEQYIKDRGTTTIIIISKFWTKCRATATLTHWQG